jgi:trans-aconitate 2-methyltransferase
MDAQPDLSPRTDPRWDSGLYDEKHSFVWKLGAALVELLAPKPGERILDLGCGTGHLTAQIASTGASVLGIDSSPAMIEQARREYPHLLFEIADAREFNAAAPFDAVFSNAVLHWITEPKRVVSVVFQVLRPGGRFVAEFGGKGNVRTIAVALEEAAHSVLGVPVPNPWYYPSIGEYADLLERSGLEVNYANLFDRPTPLEGPEGMCHWVEMFGKSFLERIPPTGRREFLRRVEDLTRPTLYRDGRWFADYRRLRVVARRGEPRGGPVRFTPLPGKS